MIILHIGCEEMMTGMKWNSGRYVVPRLLLSICVSILQNDAVKPQRRAPVKEASCALLQIHHCPDLQKEMTRKIAVDVRDHIGRAHSSCNGVACFLVRPS